MKGHEAKEVNYEVEPGGGPFCTSGRPSAIFVMERQMIGSLDIMLPTLLSNAVESMLVI